MLRQRVKYIYKPLNFYHSMNNGKEGMKTIGITVATANTCFMLF